MGVIDDSILDAVYLMVHAEIDKIKRDNVIFAKIISCEDKEKGYYKCQYQDVILYAYASHPSMNFNSGDDVYILQAAADSYNNSKIIIGKRYV